MDNVRCHYVYDEEEKIVHVDDVSRDTAKSHRYHCISCGAEMIPKLGNLRAAQDYRKSRHGIRKRNVGRKCGEDYQNQFA